MARSPLVLILPILAVAPTARAQATAPAPAWTVELSPRAEYHRGHTTYRIEGRDPLSSVVSELEFPIEVGGVGLLLRFARAREPGRGGPSFALSGFLSGPEGRGTLKDSDWISGRAELDEVGAAHEGRDIYSESTADVSARALEARGAWEFDALAPGLVLAPMVGLLYQRFDFDVHDVTQWGYGPWDTVDYTGSASGRVLEYRVRYLVPYVGGRAALTRGRFRASAELWGSPFASAEDEDDHVLRYKLSTTDASGSAWSASVSAGVVLGARDSLEAQATIVRVRATGTQRQRFYDGPYAGMWGEIPSTITSSRAVLVLAYSHAL